MPQELVTGSSPRQDEEAAYPVLLRSIRERFAGTVEEGASLFRVDTADMFPLFLAALPEHLRQQYTCSACRRFVNRFGRVVKIGPDGRLESVLWDADAAPDPVRDAVGALQSAVVEAKVDSVFLAKEAVWGVPVSRVAKEPFEWHHMSVAPDPRHIHRHPLLTAPQAMAAKREEYGMLCRSFEEFTADHVAQAVALLKSETFYRSEKCIGVAEWLSRLYVARTAERSEVRRAHITWLAVASAPAGYCHVRSGMIGTLLEDIAAAKPVAEIQRRFADKMHPLKYQRPQVGPSDGNVEQAEKIVRALASAGALDRRFAKAEEVEALWRPSAKNAAPAEGGVFGYLKSKVKGPDLLEIQGPKMTWEKFQRELLPTADHIEFQVPARGSFIALVTAVNAEAVPILQWDREERRNPVSWYVYHNGSPAEQWHLQSGRWVAVTAITRLPPNWHGAEPRHHGDGVILLLEGAHDRQGSTGMGFFPEQLRSEYHPVRRTMEAHARAKGVAGAEEATACGVDARKGATWDHVVRVTDRTRGTRTSLTLDRWD